MEQRLHLAAHRFTMALNQVSLSKSDLTDRPDSLNWDALHFTLEDGHEIEEAREVLSGSFLPRDVIGKAIGLIRTVSMISRPQSDTPSPTTRLGP